MEKTKGGLSSLKTAVKRWAEKAAATVAYVATMVAILGVGLIYGCILLASNIGDYAGKAGTYVYEKARASTVKWRQRLANTRKEKE